MIGTTLAHYRITGEKLFEGETVSDVMAAVLTCEPDLSDLPLATPGFVRHVIERCLRRDPSRRMRDIGDVRLEIEEPVDFSPDSVLFAFERHTSNVSHEYSVSLGGESIVTTRIPEASKPREIRVVLNWAAELERLAEPREAP